jgi:hypothetical protein
MLMLLLTLFFPPPSPILSLSRRQFLYTYFSSNPSTPSDKLQAATTQKYLTALRSGDNVALTRGSAMALGVLPVRYVNALLCTFLDYFVWVGDVVMVLE